MQINQSVMDATVASVLQHVGDHSALPGCQFFSQLIEFPVLRQVRPSPPRNPNTKNFLADFQQPIDEALIEFKGIGHMESGWSSSRFHCAANKTSRWTLDSLLRV
jgi:hypothetical protein